MYIWFFVSEDVDGCGGNSGFSFCLRAVLLNCSKSFLMMISVNWSPTDSSLSSELKAWTIRKGTLASKAAGKIHGDMERGFIRAEIVSFSDFTACGSEQAAKERGLLRSEGKDHPVQDGDIIHFRFNV